MDFSRKLLHSTDLLSLHVFTGDSRFWPPSPGLLVLHHFLRVWYWWKRSWNWVIGASEFGPKIGQKVHILHIFPRSANDGSPISYTTLSPWIGTWCYLHPLPSILYKLAFSHCLWYNRLVGLHSCCFFSLFCYLREISRYLISEFKTLKVLKFHSMLKGLWRLQAVVRYWYQILLLHQQILLCKILYLLGHH